MMGMGLMENGKEDDGDGNGGMKGNRDQGDRMVGMLA